VKFCAKSALPPSSPILLSKIKKTNIKFHVEYIATFYVKNHKIFCFSQLINIILMRYAIYFTKYPILLYLINFCIRVESIYMVSHYEQMQFTLYLLQLFMLSQYYKLFIFKTSIIIIIIEIYKTPLRQHSTSTFQTKDWIDSWIRSSK